VQIFLALLLRRGRKNIWKENEKKNKNENERDRLYICALLVSFPTKRNKHRVELKLRPFFPIPIPEYFLSYSFTLFQQKGQGFNPALSLYSSGVQRFYESRHKCGNRGVIVTTFVKEKKIKPEL